MTDETCGCCEGIETVTPRSTWNRPGLSRLSYRIGTHPDFFQSMIARLTLHELENGTRPLRGLTTRASDDPAMALLDCWATVADVLTFYQERIANEGYLATATERLSVQEMGRLVGYRLRPGVAATAYLAFSLEDGFETEIPAGTLARSLPGPDELAEPFETAEALQARAAWNALKPRQNVPFLLEPVTGFEGTRTAYLDGTASMLAANDVILAARDTEAVAYQLRSIEHDDALKLTRVHYADFAPAVPAGSAPVAAAAHAGTALGELGAVVESLRLTPSVQPASRHSLARPPARIYSAEADLGPRILTAFTPALKNTLVTAYENAPVTGLDEDDVFGIEAMRVKAAPFGATAPLRMLVSDGVVTGYEEWALAEIRASLGISARVSPGTPGTLAQAFATLADPESNVYPPIELVFSAADPVGAVPELGISLSDLATEEDSEFPENVVQVGEFALGASQVRVRAVYVDTRAGERLSGIEVTFLDGREVRTATIFATAPARLLHSSIAFLDGTIYVHVAGLEAQGVQPGAPVVRLTDPTGRCAALFLDAGQRDLRIDLDEPRFAATETALRLLSLDGSYDGIVPGGRIVLDRPRARGEVYNVRDVHTVARADYGISQTVTRLVLDRDWLSPAEDTTLASIRNVSVYAANETLALAEEPLTTDVFGAEIELDGFFEGLEVGRWLVVTGERTDVLSADGLAVPGIMASELVMVAGVEHGLREITNANGDLAPLPRDTLHTRVTLAKPLAYVYRRDTVAIAGNVVAASHGETVAETLGGSDGSTPFQTFALASSPLTHTPAAVPEGVESTLEVRVNDIRWRESAALFTVGPDDLGYETHTDDDGATHITFGDGRRGALPPSGPENLTAHYRSGIGAGGNVAACQISNLGPKPLGVKEVINPMRASGGADPESRDDARSRVPIAVQALDRLVSIEDYSDFTRLFAGIGKAGAVLISDGQREVVHVTIAGAYDAPIDETSELFRNLRASLVAYGDPSLPVVLSPRRVIFIFVRASVKVEADYLWSKVAPRLRAALTGAFGFARRALGQSIYLSEVISVMQAVEGVAHADVDLFEGVSETDAISPKNLADRLAGFSVSSAQARQRLPVAIAHRASDGRLLPTEIAYLNPDIEDSLVLTEVTS